MLTWSFTHKKASQNCSNFSSTFSTSWCWSTPNKNQSHRGCSSTRSRVWTRSSRLWRRAASRPWLWSRLKSNSSTKHSTRRRTPRPKCSCCCSCSRAVRIWRGPLVIGFIECCMSFWIRMRFCTVPFLRCSLICFCWAWSKTRIWTGPWRLLRDSCSSVLRRSQIS